MWMGVVDPIQIYFGLLKKYVVIYNVVNSSFLCENIAVVSNDFKVMLMQRWCRIFGAATEKRQHVCR